MTGHPVNQYLVPTINAVDFMTIQSYESSSG